MNITEEAHRASNAFLSQCGYTPFFNDTRWDDKTETYYTMTYWRKELSDRVCISRVLPSGSLERLPDQLTKAATGLAKKRGKKPRAEVLGPEVDAE